jgi:hypothetical protein
MSHDIEISGAECVSALLLDGFRIRSRTPGATTLMRGSKLVVVPDTLILPAKVLDAILSSAEVSYETFLELISEEPTQPMARVIAEC